MSDDINEKFKRLTADIELPDDLTTEWGVTLLMTDGIQLRFSGISYDVILDELMNYGAVHIEDISGRRVTVFAYAVGAVISDNNA